METLSPDLLLGYLSSSIMSIVVHFQELASEEHWKSLNLFCHHSFKCSQPHLMWKWTCYISLKFSSLCVYF